MRPGYTYFFSHIWNPLQGTIRPILLSGVPQRGPLSSNILWKMHFLVLGLGMLAPFVVAPLPICPFFLDIIFWTWLSSCLIEKNFGQKIKLAQEFVVHCIKTHCLSSANLLPRLLFTLIGISFAASAKLVFFPRQLTRLFLISCPFSLFLSTFGKVPVILEITPHRQTLVVIYMPISKIHENIHWIKWKYRV